MYAYFSHHKCGTAWVENIIRNTCQLLGLRLKVCVLPKKFPNNWEDPEFIQINFYRRLPENWRGIDFFCHTNAERGLLEEMKRLDYRAFHVIRDPRDILVSGYFSHKISHIYSPLINPWMFEHRQRLNQVSKEEGLSLEMDYCEVFFERIANWDYSNPQIYEIRYEVLTKNSYNDFCKIFDFLGFHITDASTLLDPSIYRVPVNTALRYLGFKTSNNIIPKTMFKYILHRNSFEVKSERKKGIEDQSSHYRKGVPGDWKNHLNGKNKNKFKERYGQLLIDLDYEKDFDW